MISAFAAPVCTPGNKGIEGSCDGALPKSLDSLYLVNPNAETFEHVPAEGHADGYVRGIPTSRNQYTAKPRCVIARIKRVPGATDVGLKPGRKILRLLRGRKPDIAYITGAIASRNIQTATERNSQMGVIPADASLFVE